MDVLKELKRAGRDGLYEKVLGSDVYWMVPKVNGPRGLVSIEICCAGYALRIDNLTELRRLVKMLQYHLAAFEAAAAVANTGGHKTRFKISPEADKIGPPTI